MKAFVLILFTSACVFCAHAESVMYQYTDEKGQTIISNTLPAEAANRGYSVISSRGNVIEKVPPKLTDEQIIELNKAKDLEAKEQAKQAFAEQQKKLQNKKDMMLLKIFTNVEDIKRSRNDKIETIEIQQAITRDNIARLESQLKRTEAAIQAHQQQNSPVPEQLQNTVEESKKQLKENREFLISKKIEKEDIQKRYQTMITRFQELKEGSAPKSYKVKTQGSVEASEDTH